MMCLCQHSDVFALMFNSRDSVYFFAKGHLVKIRKFLPPPHRSLHVALASGRWGTTVVDCQLAIRSISEATDARIADHDR